MHDFIYNNRDDLKLNAKYKSFYIDDINVGQAAENTEKDFVGLTINHKKINWLTVFFLLGLSVLFTRIWYLQIKKGDYYNSISEGNRIRIRSLKPQRGIIYDRQGKQLVTNVPSFSLKIVQSDLPKDDIERGNLIRDIAELIDLNADDINKILEEKKEYFYQDIIIKEDIDYDKALLLYIKSIDMPGVILEEDSKRKYISDDNLNSISHILGYDGKISEMELKNHKSDDYLLDDYIGKTGVELSFEKELRGILGKSQIETNALGKQIRIIAQKDAVPGADLVLTIDLDLQNFVENLLKEELKKNKKEKATAIIMDPRNGEILSLVSIPSFNNNLFVGGISKENYQALLNDPSNPLFNRSIAGEYPPGSTFKPVLSAIGLKEGVITQNTTVRSVGGIWVGQWFFPDWRAGGHGIVNVQGAIANSVNTFFYYLGGGYNDFKGLGVDNIAENLKQFNMGEKTGIDLPGESTGFVPTQKWKEEKFKEPWYIGDTYHLSIGQGYLLVTPLQIAWYTSFFANNGILYKPHVAKDLIYKGLKKEIAIQEIKKNIIDPGDIEIIKEGMKGTVDYGSARSLTSLPFPTAGKTGTAQTSPDKEPHAWFTAFAPYDSPKIVVTVLIEEGGEGSSVSVPVVKKILEYWWEHKREI